MRGILLLLIVLSSDCRSAFEKSEAGAGSFAMGNAVVAVPFSMNAIFNNPAALDTSPDIYAQLSARNFYSLPGISQIDMVMGFRLFNSPLAMSISRFGNEKYQEIQFAVAGAYNFSDDIYLGLAFQSYFLSIPGYGADNSFGINLGLLFRIDNNLYCGTMISNINQPVIGNVSEELPQCFSLGICYIPQNRLTIATEIFRDIRFDSDFRLGISYQFEYPIIIRIGFQDGVNSFCLGTGMSVGSFFIDYAIQLHQILEESHIFSIAVRL